MTRARKCRHRLQRYEIATVFGETSRRIYALAFGPGAFTVPSQLRCEGCDMVMPLGRSNDEPEAVKIEMRAAAKFACAMTSGTTDRCDCSEGRLPNKQEDLSEEIYKALWGMS